MSSSSTGGSGGTSSESGGAAAAGLGGREREHERDEALRPRGMPNRSCSTCRAPDALGVVGREAAVAAGAAVVAALGSRCVFVDGRGVLSAPMAGVGFLGFGVADGVTVVLVVDDSGREGMREAGLDAGLGFRGVGARAGMVVDGGRGAGCSCFDLERDLERVRKL